MNIPLEDLFDKKSINHPSLEEIGFHLEVVLSTYKDNVGEDDLPSYMPGLILPGEAKRGCNGGHFCTKEAELKKNQKEKNLKRL
jgi:hypothetical protein